MGSICAGDSTVTCAHTGDATSQVSGDEGELSGQDEPPNIPECNERSRRSLPLLDMPPLVDFGSRLTALSPIDIGFDPRATEMPHGSIVSDDEALLFAVKFLTAVPLISIHETTLTRVHSLSSVIRRPDSHACELELGCALEFLTSIDSLNKEMWILPEEAPLTKKRKLSGYFQRIPLRVLQDHAVLENSFIRKGLLGSHLVLSDNRSPFTCFSVLQPGRRADHFDDLHARSQYASTLKPQRENDWARFKLFRNGKRRSSLLRFDAPLAPIDKYKKKTKKKTGYSFAHLLTPKATLHDPFVVVDPRAIMHATTKITTLSLECYTISIIPFVRPKRLKEECNDYFAKKHPWLHKSLTLSKLRNLKQDLLAITDKFPSLDISTVACAWVYFERLIRKKCVHKSNRKLIAGVCLLLAAKFNQSFHGKDFRRFAICIREMDRKDRLYVSDIRHAEFKVFSLLGFELHLDPVEVVPQLEGFFNMKEQHITDYYGDLAADILDDEASHSDIQCAGRMSFR